MTSRSMIALVCTGLLAAACAAPPAEEDDSAAISVADSLTKRQEEQLAQVRAATAKYQDVSAALADGYVGDPECVVMPDGGMGYHYIHFGLLMQPPQQNKPAILLYEPRADGGLRLIGVEYFTPVFVNGEPWFADESSPPPPGSYNPAPVLFGVPFDGPMPGHNAQMPWHYDLHVWLWKHNPSGMFHHTNPAVTCK